MIWSDDDSSLEELLGHFWKSAIPQRMAKYLCMKWRYGISDA
jgi:hypothetical protein